MDNEIALFDLIFRGDHLLNHIIVAFQKSIFIYFNDQQRKQKSIDQRDVMSKCARQLLKIRNLLISTNIKQKQFYSYLITEKIYLQFEKVFNNTMEKLLKSDSHILMKNYEKILFDMDETDDGGIVQNDNDDEVDYLSETKSESEDDNDGDELKIKQMEYNAGIRMRQRAQRVNIGHKLEEFFRRESTNDEYMKKERNNYKSSTLELQLQMFTSTLEEQLRETGIATDSDVKVHLITTTTNINDDWFDKRLSSLLEAFLDEQKLLNNEKKLFNQMQNAYLFTINFNNNNNNINNNQHHHQKQSSFKYNPHLPILNNNFHL